MNIMKTLTLTMVAVAAVFFTACRAVDTRITEDGCILLGRPVEGRGTVYAGACADGRYLIEWVSTQPDGSAVSVRATRRPNGSIAISYHTPGGWVEWSSKSGVVVGTVPQVPSGLPQPPQTDRSHD